MPLQAQFVRRSVPYDDDDCDDGDDDDAADDDDGDNGDDGDDDGDGDGDDDDDFSPSISSIASLQLP